MGRRLPGFSTPGEGEPASALFTPRKHDGGISSATGVTRADTDQRHPAANHNNDEDVTVDNGGNWRTEPTLIRDLLADAIADLERRCEDA